MKIKSIHVAFGLLLYASLTILVGCAVTPAAPKPAPKAAVVPTSILPPGFHAPLAVTVLGQKISASQVVQLPDTKSYVYSANIVGLVTNKQGQTVLYDQTQPAHLIESDIPIAYGQIAIRFVDDTHYAYRVQVEDNKYPAAPDNGGEYTLWGSPDLKDWIHLDCVQSYGTAIELFDRSDHSTEPIVYYQVTKTTEP
jgi:hypothetical protein